MEFICPCNSNEVTITGRSNVAHLWLDLVHKFVQWNIYSSYSETISLKFYQSLTYTYHLRERTVQRQRMTRQWVPPVIKR
jgi:hypothetical protein